MRTEGKDFILISYPYLPNQNSFGCSVLNIDLEFETSTSFRGFHHSVLLLLTFPLVFWSIFLSTHKMEVT